MAIIAASEVVDPSRLEKEEKDRFIRELYSVHSQIFDGVDEKCFAIDIFCPDAIRTRVKIFRKNRKEIVGYLAIHLYEMRFTDADTIAVFRAEAGFLPPYRRKKSTLSLVFAEFCRYKCLHPRRQAYYIGTLVHPSSYHLIFHYFHEMYPTYMCETPPYILQAMCNIAKNFGIEPVCRYNPLIVRVGWRVRNDRENLEYWSQCDKLDVKFFLKKNPGYLEGEGLLTLVPLSWSNLIWLFISRVIEVCGKRWSG